MATHVLKYEFTCQYCGHTGASSRATKRFCDIDCRHSAQRNARAELPPYFGLTPLQSVPRLQKAQREKLKRLELKDDIDNYPNPFKVPS